MAIPRLIHQTAKTRELTPQCEVYQRKLLSLHPDWQYHLWTDEDNLGFVSREFPDFLETFVSLPKPIMRADVIRYLLMYKLGGLYLDTDYEMLRPFDLLNFEAVLPWESCKYQGEGILCNSIFASVPGHPLFKLMIDDLKANPPLGPNLNVLQATGPEFVTRVYRRAAGLNLQIYMAPKELFSPPTPCNEREYRAIIRDGVAYGIHHCHGSWREWTLLQRAKMAVGRVYRRFT